MAGQAKPAASYLKQIAQLRFSTGRTIEMPTFYTNEKNVQMLIFLLKAHGIRKVIVSPGTTNMCFVGDAQPLGVVGRIPAVRHLLHTLSDHSAVAAGCNCQHRQFPVIGLCQAGQIIS